MSRSRHGISPRQSRVNQPETTPSHVRTHPVLSRLNSFLIDKQLHPIENRPHPLKAWKNADPRVRNLFASAVIAVPGFIALVGGIDGAVSNHGVVSSCVPSKNGAHVTDKKMCSSAVKGEERDAEYALGGLAEDALVIAVMARRDAKLLAAQTPQALNRDVLMAAR